MFDPWRSVTWSVTSGVLLLFLFCFLLFVWFFFGFFFFALLQGCSVYLASLLKINFRMVQGRVVIWSKTWWTRTVHNDNRKSVIPLSLLMTFGQQWLLVSRAEKEYFFSVTFIMLYPSWALRLYCYPNSSNTPWGQLSIKVWQRPWPTQELSANHRLWPWPMGILT